MTLWRRLYAGNLTRKSRFHDEFGERVSLDRAMRNGPQALITGIGRLLFKARPEIPWISYDAQALLASILTPASVVLEFGSGMSTAWYGRHAGQVVSIEDYEVWYQAVSARLAMLGNVEYHFAEDRAAYVGLAPDQPYDLIMIDGNWREDCVRFAISHLRIGGVIYLDNSDKQYGDGTGDVPAAAAMLKDFACQQRLPLREFTDFAPTQLFVQRALMIGGPPLT